MYSKIALGGLAFAAALACAAATFDLTLTLGTTAYVLTATQVSVAAASVAALAIAKQALTLAAIADSRRGKREIPTPLDFSVIFEGIDQSDVAGCGKLLVCHAMAKDDSQKTNEEKLIANLFDDLSTIQPNAYGRYQWAAYAGSFKNPTICAERYGQCPVSVEELANLINPQ